MASLDLGTLIAKIKVEGAATAQSALRGVSSMLGQTTTNTTGAASGMGSFTNAVSGALGNINICGTNLGTLATAFGGSEVASIAMGTALGGVVTAGIMAGVTAVKALASACVEFISSSNEVGINFQKQMSVVQAISGSTDKDLNLLTQTARQLGKDTIFSATEVAQALEYTSLAGWNAQESIEGLPGILNLAAASNMDLAKASDYVTDYLTAFGMKISESTKLADVMAYTMSNTNTNTLQLGEAYKNCAATANTFGLSVEETSSWIGVMANASIKGGEAGTALNAVLARMYGETKTTNDAMMEYGLSMYDANGNAKNFTQVMGEMQEAMKGMNDQQQNVFLKAVAGVNHLSEFSTMIQVSASDVNNFTKELENSAGTSETMSETMTKNIAGLQKSISSKTDDIKLSLFDAFSPLETDLLLVVDNFLNQVSANLKPFGQIIGGFFNVFTPIFEGVNKVGGLIAGLIADILEPFAKMFTIRFEEMGSRVGFFVDIIVGACELIAKAIKPVTAIFATVVDATIQIYQAMKIYLFDKLAPFKSAIDEFVEGFKEGFLLLPNIVLVAVNAVIDLLNKIPGVAIDNVEYLTDTFDKAMGKVSNKTKEYNDSVKSMEKATKDTAKNVSKSWDDLSDDVDEKVSHITSTMKKVSSGGTYSSWSGGVSQNFSVKGAYANGTDYVPSTGRYLVGERGPEIVTLSQGASVTPNHEIGGTTNTYHITIDASNVREFNDVINMVNGYTQNSRMGGV